MTKDKFARYIEIQNKLYDVLHYIKDNRLTDKDILDVYSIIYNITIIMDNLKSDRKINHKEMLDLIKHNKI